MDEYGGVLEVQGLWVNIGFPMGGTPLGESDWHNHIQATWGKKREGQLGKGNLNYGCDWFQANPPKHLDLI